MKRPGQEAAKRLNINWGSFYRNVFALVIPMAIQNLINVGVTAADVIMLGRVGEKVLSGASLAGQIQFIMTLIFMGITSGATVLTAQYWGKKDTRTIEKVLGMGLAAGLFTAVAFAAAALFIPEALMRIYSSDPAVIAEGIRYCQAVHLSQPDFGSGRRAGDPGSRADCQRYAGAQSGCKGYLTFMFFVMSYFTIAQSLNCTMVVGIFRSGGDTRLGLIMDVSTMWGFSILLGAVAAFVFHASVPIVYVILMSDELIKVPITIKRYLSYKWLKNVTREKEELEGA